MPTNGSKASYCNLVVAREIANTHASGCRTRKDIANLLRAYRRFGYNNATLYEVSYRIQKLTDNVK